MNNALGVAWRIPCAGLRASSWLAPSTSTSPLRSSAPLRLSTSTATLPWQPDSIARRLLSSWSSQSSPLSRQPTTPSSSLIPIRSLHSTHPLRANHPTSPDQSQEQGAHPRSTPFTTTELKTIFGPRTKLPPALANRVLAVLHGRRLLGTLDLNLPADIVRSVHPRSLELALKYLRANYPVDEDAAILARVEREMDEEEARNVQRYMPQGGEYGADVNGGASASHNPSGKSVLEEVRTQNEAYLLAEQERKRQEWLSRGMQHDERVRRSLEKNSLALRDVDEKTALEIAPKDRQLADPKQRPVLAWVQKNYMAAEDLDFDLNKLTLRQRLLPSLAFVLLTLGLCYAYTMYYEPPATSDRLWPNIPRSAATVGTIIGINTAIFALWWFPPCWRLFNRYLISIPANPNPPVRLLGNIFSHQYPKHLISNMLFLWFIGTKLHDEIGRGEFLSLYIASGVVGSFVTLTAHCLMAQWTVSALGASGALSGVVAAYCTLNANENLQFFFLPEEWKKMLSVPGWTIITTMVALESISLVRRLRGPHKLDHWAHMGGYLTGISWALCWPKTERKHPESGTTWYRWLSSKN
ncbi:hypothetical protein CBS147353_6065 [Aspergillus niger]|nr:hypothetical protein CBS147353_6065 [Aspergillus niger]